VLVEDAVGFDRFVERHDVRDQESGVDGAVLNQTQQLLPVLLNQSLTTAHCKTLLHKWPNREAVAEVVIISNNADCATLAHRVDTLVQLFWSVGLQLERSLNLMRERFGESET